MASNAEAMSRPTIVEASAPRSGSGCPRRRAVRGRGRAPLGELLDPPEPLEPPHAASTTGKGERRAAEAEPAQQLTAVQPQLARWSGDGFGSPAAAICQSHPLARRACVTTALSARSETVRPRPRARHATEVGESGPALLLLSSAGPRRSAEQWAHVDHSPRLRRGRDRRRASPALHGVPAARGGSGCSAWRRATASAAPGTGTGTRARAATPSRCTTPSPSCRTSSRSGRSRSGTRPSR